MVGIFYTISQIGIFVLGSLTILLLGRKTQRWRRWGYVSGICSEPFWLLSSVQWNTIYVDGVLSWPHMQWGILLLMIISAWGWTVGLKNNWKIVEEK